MILIVVLRKNVEDEPSGQTLVNRLRLLLASEPDIVISATVQETLEVPD